MSDIKAPATYRLTQDVVNPHPDLRHRHDWRHRPMWEKGTIFHTQMSYTGREERTMSLYSGRWSHKDTFPHQELWETLVPHLELVEDFGALMHELDEVYSTKPHELLEWLVASEKLTHDDIRAAAEGLSQAWAEALTKDVE